MEAKDGFSIATYSQSFRDAAYAALSRMAIADGDWNLALAYSSKSPSLFCGLAGEVALRHLGDKDACRAVLDRYGSELPLFPFFNFERSLLDGNPSSFPETLKCELPHETLLEMALWYLDCGLEEEAATLCGLTDYPTATYLRAYMLREKDPSRSLELLEKADAASPGFVFPFRPEMLEVFDWAAATGGSWKSGYYRALILWRHARKDEARDLMEGCGDKPDPCQETGAPGRPWSISIPLPATGMKPAGTGRSTSGNIPTSSNSDSPMPTPSAEPVNMQSR